MSTRIDREALHREFFEKSDRQDCLRLNQLAYAVEHGYSKFTMSRIMRDFIDQGRVKHVSTTKNSVNVYQITDPIVWRAERNGLPVPEERTPKERKIQWG